MTKTIKEKATGIMTHVYVEEFFESFCTRLKWCPKTIGQMFHDEKNNIIFCFSCSVIESPLPDHVLRLYLDVEAYQAPRKMISSGDDIRIDFNDDDIKKTDKMRMKIFGSLLSWFFSHLHLEHVYFYEEVEGIKMDAPF